MTEEVNLTHYVAFVLSSESRELLRELWPPEMEIERCHHVTLEHRITDRGMSLLGTKPRVRLLGFVSGLEVDCALVMVDGEVLRSDGHYYHVTLSHSRNVSPAHSNVVIPTAVDNRAIKTAKPGIYLTGTVGLLLKTSSV